MITLKTLPEATEQEVFDQVARHLLTQGEKCGTDVGGWDTEETCFYRHNGLKCAAGCLIADDEYDASLEGNSWEQLALDADDTLVPVEHYSMISDLQLIHDNHSPEEWIFKLASLARWRRLDGSILDEFDA